MAFLARAAMGAARSGAMKGGMGDAGAGEASEQLKKVKEIQKKLESGGLDIKDIKHLGGDFLKKLEGEGFVGKSGGFEKLGIKPIDLSRNGFNEKNGIENPEKPKDSSDKISSKSRINGSLNVSKADYYDKNKLFNTEDVDPVPTYTQEPGLGEVRLEGGPSEGDIKNLGKDPKKDLDTLEKDDKLKKEDDGENDLSIDNKSFAKKLKDVTETVKQYERIAGDEKTAEEIGGIQDAVVLEKGPNINSTDSQQRLNRNIANQNAKKAEKPGSFSQTSTGPSSGGHNPTGGGPKQPKQNSKTGRYDPYRRKVSGDGLGKPLDPFREKVKSFKEKIESFYEKHENENKFDALDSANQQFNQAAGNIDNVVGGALMAMARKELEEGLGENVPVGDGESQNNNNNNNNDSNSFLKEKLGFGEKKDHKGSKNTKDVVSVKGVKGVRGKAGVGKSLESANSHHATGALKELEKEKSTIKDLFSKIHDLKENNPYVKFVSDTSDQLRYSSSDPVKVMLEKFGVAVPFGDDAGQQNNNSGMDDVLSAKIRGEKSKTPKAGTESLKLENSKVSKVEHHTNVPRLEHSGHSAKIELSKGKTEEEHTHKEKSDFFDKGADQTHHVSLERDSQILEQKKGSNKEDIHDNRRELVEAETALEIEGGEKKAMDEHNIEEAIVTARTIKDVEEFFNGNDSRDQDEKTEVKNAEQVSELSAKEEVVEETIEQKKEIREEKEEVVAERMGQRRKAVEDEMEERREEREERREEVEELVAAKMEQRKKEVQEEIDEKREMMEEKRERRQEKGIEEIEEIQTNLEEAQLKVEQDDQVNQRAAYAEQQNESERSAREVVGPEEVTTKLERIVQASEEEKGKVAGSEEDTTKLERIVQADEGFVKQVSREEDEAMNERFEPPPAYSEKERVEVTGKEDKPPSYESLDIQHDRQRSDLREEEAIFSANSRRQEPTDKPPSYESLDTRQDTERPSLKADLSQEPVIMEADAVKNVAAVKAETSEINPASEVENKLQRQLNNSEKFLLDDAAVFEKKSSHSNEAVRSIGNPVEASLSKEAMLLSDSEVPQRRDPLIEEAKGATVVGHNPGAEAMHHMEYPLDARVGNHLDTNVGGRVEEEDLKDKVKLENEQRTYAPRQVTRDSSDVLGEQRHTLEKRSLDQEAQVVETESVTNRTVPVSEASEISGAAVTDSVISKDPERYKKQEENNNSNIVEQLKSLEDERVLEKIESKPDSKNENTIEKLEYLQDNKNGESDQKTKDSRDLEEAKSLASEHTEPSEKESKTEKAARLEKDNFVSLFTGVAKPGLQTEIARNFGENAYREAKAGKEDIGKLTRNIVKNSEKLTKDFTKYLQVEEKRIEAENGANRQWQNEAQIGEGIPTH